MSLFARIEEACAAFIERAFARTFPSDLEPAQIARKLVSTMETRTQSDDGRMLAPAQYTVLVSPADYERLAAHRAYLQREWAALLADVAARVGIAFAGGDPVVTLDKRAEVVAGAVEIESAVPESAGGFALRMLKGMPADGLYPLKRTTRVGRSEDRDLFLVDPSVSRAHAIIESESGLPIVHDLGSTNGTYVNGERISSRRLKLGDTVAFGNTQLRLETIER